LLQEFVDKEDELRITVVGDSVFPVRVLSVSGSEAAIDWRIENGTQVQYQQTSISPHLTRLVMKVMRRFDLEFAAMDIVVSKTGQCYLLDLNPNGQWAWLDQLLGLGIADQLRSVLSGGG
jgi:glutathione synthase/RimK-type ligase-like ATP-grasp enzyme